MDTRKQLQKITNIKKNKNKQMTIISPEDVAILRLLITEKLDKTQKKKY
jgi:hypothetical protein